MSAVGLESIDHTVQLTHVWINDLDARLGWENKHRSYRLLRTVLQAMRDWLTVDDAAGFGAQLPELLRRALAAGYNAIQETQQSRLYCTHRQRL